MRKFKMCKISIFLIISIFCLFFNSCSRDESKKLKLIPYKSIGSYSLGVNNNPDGLTRDGVYIFNNAKGKTFMLMTENPNVCINNKNYIGKSFEEVKQELGEGVVDVDGSEIYGGEILRYQGFFIQIRNNCVVAVGINN